ncbi:MAG: triose-phosphate isomerase [Clostridiales bacterium]|nr:triose-phosphate isomerase [Clostridiales bacterium]
MNKSVRKAVIAGNWKMNKTPAQTTALIQELAPLTKGQDGCDIVVCTPFVDLANALEATKGTNIKVGAQNVHFEAAGAFTGEISAEMLCEMGVEYVIIGHSERRQYFGETDETVNKRVKAALASGLTVILCVGEMLDERENGITNEIVAMQTKMALLGVTADQMNKVIIAYEPVWAIGTGKTATADQAEEVCAFIRSVLADLYGEEAAKTVPVQYGGSMNAGNAAELLAKENIDGGLIGGASLKPADFAKIIQAAQN